MRLVGSNEYLNAIQNFTNLLANASPEEIETFNSVLGKQDEYSFSSGQHISELNNNGSKAVRDRSDAGVKKHSLQWMLALARVEVGATLAMYTDLPNPFAYVAPPGNFGQKEYYAVLLDDVAAHLNALKFDPYLNKQSDRASRTDGETVSYVRRMNVISRMLGFVKEVGDDQVVATADRFLAQVNSVRERMVSKLDRLKLLSSKKASELARSEVEVRSLSPILSACQAAFLYNARDSDQIRDDMLRLIEANGR